jgi:predicted lipoprotein with Yx(FWY)xxD motif
MRFERPRSVTWLVLASAALLGVAVAVGAGLATASSPIADPGSRTAAAPSRASKVAKVRLGRTRFGRVLVDGRGFALYLFTRDRRSRSRCYGPCAEAWPPLRTARRPIAGRGIPARRLGTTRRRRGARQVTYAGHPLYRYVGDRRPGQVLCQAVPEFGGTWYVVRRSGERVR